MIDLLAELFAMRGAPEVIRSDNRPEFVSRAIQGWLEKLGIEMLYGAPGSPWENGYAESFHSKLRDEFLSREEFESVVDALSRTSAWRADYNEHRPHSSLGYQTPSAFAARCAASAAEPPPPLQQHNDFTHPGLS